MAKKNKSTNTTKSAKIVDITDENYKPEVPLTLRNYRAVTPVILKLLRMHHHEGIAYESKVKAEYNEELIHRAFEEIGILTDWKADGNHRQGVDQVTQGGVRISNKSGQLCLNKNTVKINDSRTTHHPDWISKLEAASKKKFDVMMLLSTNNTEWRKHRRYHYLVFDAEVFNYAKWVDYFKPCEGKVPHNKGKQVGMEAKLKIEDGEVVGWEHDDKEVRFHVRMSNSMSDQFWVRVPLEWAIYYVVLDVDANHIKKIKG